MLTGTPQARNHTINQCWTPPSVGLKLNIDGSSNHASRKRGAGVFFRDNKKNWIKGFNAWVSVQIPLEAESMTLYIGLKMALHMQYDNLIIYSSSFTLTVSYSNNLEPNKNLIILCRVLLSEGVEERSLKTFLKNGQFPFVYLEGFWNRQGENFFCRALYAYSI